MQKIKKILNYLIILLFIILSLNLLSAKSQKAFDIIGYRTYTVLTGSMEPRLLVGDFIVVKNENRITTKENDIVTYKENQDIITHRIIKKVEDGYLTKGDNNNTVDKIILKEENILGKVVLRIPKLGYLIQLLSKPYIIALELIMLGIMIII